MILTPLHFVYQYIAQGFIFEHKDHIMDSTSTNKITLFKQGKKKNIKSNSFLFGIRKYAEFFADLSTQLFSLRKFKSSKIGMVCILCARKQAQIVPVWNEYFSWLAPYTMEELEEPFSMLYRFYLNSFHMNNRTNKNASLDYSQDITLNTIKIS